MQNGAWQPCPRGPYPGKQAGIVKVQRTCGLSGPRSGGSIEISLQNSRNEDLAFAEPDFYSSWVPTDESCFFNR